MVKKSTFWNDKWMGIATLIGVIIGAGVLGIPYVIATCGFFLGSLVIICIGLVFLVLNLFLGEIVLRTKGKHQLSGYIEKYLGKTGKMFMAFSMVFGIYGALTAYIIGEGEAMRALFLGTFNLSPMFYSIVFFCLVSLLIYSGVKSVGKAELVFIIGMLSVVLLICFFSLSDIEYSHLTEFHPDKFLFPLGVIIFSFISSAAIPEVNELVKDKKKDFKNAIIIGSLIPIFIYLIFSFAVIGIVGLENFDLLEPNERIATVALSFFSNHFIGLLANLFAIIAMLTSFVALGIGLVDMYHYDFNISRNTSLFLVLSIPLILTLTKISTFMVILGITGVVAGGLDGILIVLAYWKAKKLGVRKPEFEFMWPKYLGYLIIGLFLFGMIQQLYSLI